MENEQWWQDHLHGIDTIIHIAWYVEPGKYLNSDKNIECMQGTLTLAKAAIATGVKKFVGIGTCFEYDLDQDFLSTSSPLKPLTIYAAAKAATYISLSQWLATHAVEFAWCRLFYLYGEGEDNRRFVPYLRSKLVAGEPAELTSGKQVRDFMNIDEAGKLIALTAIEDHQGPINICSGLPITIRQLAESIADEYGRRDLLKFGVRADNLIDPPRVVGIKSFNTP
nr:NAD-dependent epimerase/dehydratase family protein [Shewanella aestuarii]